MRHGSRDPDKDDPLSAPNAWHPRSDDPLFILAMDHRASFVEVLLGKEIDKPNDQQLAHLNEAKDLVYRGLSTAKPQLPFGRPAVLVDELYGGGVIRSAKEEATILAIPVEESGQSWFTLQWGDAWLDHVRRIAPDYAKVLVRDNPLLPADKRRAQLDDLAHVSDGLRKVNVPLLYELLVPPMPSQLAAANESADRFDRDLRPELARQVIADNQASA
jgi:myo-inositol catabolism protein IolC